MEIKVNCPICENEIELDIYSRYTFIECNKCKTLLGFHLHPNNQKYTITWQKKETNILQEEIKQCQ